MKVLEGELLRRLIESSAQVLNSRTSASTRAAGDAIERIVGNLLPELLSDVNGTWESELGARDRADARVQTIDGTTDFDIKTHRTGRKFSRSNIISVKRLVDFYEKSTNVFVLVLVTYSVEGSDVTFESCRAFPVEWLSWDSLTLGLLGWGQLQFKTTGSYKLVDRQNRAEWMTELCDQLLAFYPREISKMVETRLTFFQRAREKWASKE